MFFSVLMSVYAKERPEYLRLSLDSVFDQTIKADEIVLIEDGPLTNELYLVLDEYENSHPELKRVKLKENNGLGKALNIGLKHCSYDLVARMDTDDIAKPTRFEKQIKFMEDNPDVDACGSWIEEFLDTKDKVVSLRKLPCKHSELITFAHKRNPLNHPTVVFRKNAVEKAGGYMHFPLFEDYYLWVRMLIKGSTIANIPESLLWFRTSPEMFKRRGGWKYAKDELAFQKELNRIGFISNIEYLKNIAIRFGIRLMPNTLRGFIYKNILRK